MMVGFANSEDALKKKMKKILQDFHEVKPSAVKFELAYDLTALFTQRNYLNVSAIALKAGINPTLMRQYVAGLKYPSPDRAKAIEGVINELGRELIGIKVAVPKTKTAVKSKRLNRKMNKEKGKKRVSPT